MNDIILDKWNIIKKQTSRETILVGFKTRDIFNIKIGVINKDDYENLKRKYIELLK